MQIELNLSNVKCVNVCEATSPGAFLPFTVLPDEYRGQTVALVIVTPAMQIAMAVEQDPQGELL